MIIKATRIKATSGPYALAAHVFHGAGNEQIEVLRGSEAYLAEMFKDAVWAGHSYAVRHFVISPARYSRETLSSATRKLADEFGFDLGDAVIIKHHKPRADGSETADRHLHMLVPEMTGDGRVLSCGFMYARHEKIARLVELETGEPLTKGRHNRAVHQALIQSGQTQEAAHMRALTEGPPAMSAYSTRQFQRAKRLGYNLAEIHQLLKGKQGRRLDAALETLRADGLSCLAGTGGESVLVTSDRQVIASLDRLRRTHPDTQTITATQQEKSDENRTSEPTIRTRGKIQESVKRAEFEDVSVPGAAQADTAQTPESLNQHARARSGPHTAQQADPATANEGDPGNLDDPRRRSQDFGSSENAGRRSGSGPTGRGHHAHPGSAERHQAKPDSFGNPDRKTVSGDGIEDPGTHPGAWPENGAHPALIRARRKQIAGDVDETEPQRLRRLHEPRAQNDIAVAVGSLPRGGVQQAPPVPNPSDKGSVPEKTAGSKGRSAAPNPPSPALPRKDPEASPPPFPISSERMDRPVSGSAGRPETSIQSWLESSAGFDQRITKSWTTDQRQSPTRNGDKGKPSM